MPKQPGYFDNRSYTEKIRENNVDFLTIEITPKKVGGNDVDFRIIKISYKKVRGNDVDF